MVFNGVFIIPVVHHASNSAQVAAIAVGSIILLALSVIIIIVVVVVVVRSRTSNKCRLADPSSVIPPERGKDKKVIPKSISLTKLVNHTDGDV